MRRDLSRGCDHCLLRFSEALTSCPACDRAALSVPAASWDLDPSSRARWLSKWAYVLALPLMLAGLNAYWSDKIPLPWSQPGDFFDKPLGWMVFATLCFSWFFTVPLVVAATPIAWLGQKIGPMLGPRTRALFVALDRERRVDLRAGQPPTTLYGDEPIHLAERVKAYPWSRIALFSFAFMILDIVVGYLRENMDLFSDLSSRPDRLFIFLGIHALLFGKILLIRAAFVLVAKRPAAHYLLSPPGFTYALFVRPAPLQNEALVARWTEGRDALVGRASSLTADERASLAEHLTSGSAQSQAALREALTAPFSHKPCIAFRVTGKSEGLPLDDADAVSFAVEAEDGQRCIVHADDVVVRLPPSEERYTSGGEDFLDQRGLPRLPLAARESRLEEGARVRVHGRLTRIPIASMGYRERGTAEVMAASDGSPIVLAANPRAATGFPPIDSPRARPVSWSR